jgi:hypothetical protein
MSHIEMMQRIVEDIASEDGALNLGRYDVWLSELRCLTQAERRTLLPQIAGLAREALAMGEARLAQQLGELASMTLERTLRTVHLPLSAYQRMGAASFAGRVPEKVVSRALSAFTALENGRLNELGPEGRIPEHLRVRTREHPDLAVLETIAEEIAAEVSQRSVVALRDSDRWGVATALHSQNPPQRDFGPHVDLQGRPEKPIPIDRVTTQVLMYLTDVDQECGPTGLWLESARLLHRVVIDDSLLYRHQLAKYYAPVARQCARIGFLARAGDCLALDHLCLHSIVSNVSSRTRVAFRFLFVAVK